MEEVLNIAGDNARAAGYTAASHVTAELTLLGFRPDGQMNVSRHLGSHDNFTLQAGEQVRGA